MLKSMSKKEKAEILNADLLSPLFFLYPIKKNTAYIDLLISLLSQKNALIDEVAHLLASQDNWHSRYIDTMINALNKEKNTLPVTAVDIAYCGLLLNKISRDTFFDYILFNAIKESFSKMPLCFEMTPTINHIVDTENDYLKAIINKVAQSGLFFFEENALIEQLRDLLPLPYFTVALHQNEFLSSIKGTEHLGWFQLFSREKYPLLTFESAADNTLYMHIPSIRIIQAFLTSIAKNKNDIVTPVMAYGIISMETSHHLHNNNLHITSIQDDRFKSVTVLHGDAANSFEVIMHDLLFHTTMLSARPLAIRKLFLRHVFPTLKNFVNSKHDFLDHTDSVSLEATRFFYTHLLETSLDISMAVPQKNMGTVTSSVLHITLYMLLGSTRQTYHYFFSKLSEKTMAHIVAQAIEALFLYFRNVCNRHTLIIMIEKYLYSLVLQASHPVQSILKEACVYLNLRDLQKHKISQ